MLGGGGGSCATGEHPTLPMQFLVFVHLREMGNVAHSTASYSWIFLSYTVIEARAIEEREDPCIFDDKEGRVK